MSAEANYLRRERDNALEIPPGGLFSALTQRTIAPWQRKPA